MRQLVGLCIELRIRQALILVLHRQRFRCAFHLLLEQLMDQRLPRILGLRGIELIQHPFALWPIQQRQVRERRIRCFQAGRQQPKETAHKAFYPIPVKQRSAVIHPARHVFVAVIQLQTDVVGRIAQRKLAETPPHAGRLTLRLRCTLEAEDILEHRRAGQVPFGHQTCNQLLEGRIGMLQRTQHAFADRLGKGSERCSLRA